MKLPALLVLAGLTLTSCCHCTVAAEPSPERLLPKTTVAYLRVSPLENLLSSPLLKTIRSSDAFKTVWRSPDVMKLRGGMTFAEFALGEKLETLAEKLTDQGLCIGVDKSTEGVVLLAYTESKEWLEDYLPKLAKLARSDAENKKQPDPVKEADYRGIHGYEFQKLVFGNLGSILIVSNKSELAKDIIDRYLDSNSASIESNPLYKISDEARAKRATSQDAIELAYGFVDLQALRDAGAAKDLLGDKRKDFAAELLLGGILSTLQKTGMALGSLQLKADGFGVDLSVPHQKEWTQASHTFYVGADGSGAAPQLVDAKNMVGSVSAYRNLSEMWNRAGDLFDEQVNDQLAQADSTLTTLFSGKDFGTDILGAIEPQIQLVALEQAFEKGHEPAIQLPAFGLIAKLKDPSMQKDLKRIFQNFIGFLNVVGAMEGQPQLDLDMESIDGVQVYTASYLRDGDRKYENGLPIQFNFSPTLAFSKNIVYIASSKSLVSALSASNATTTFEPLQVDSKQGRSNTIVRVNAEPLRKVLLLNRQQLISQNMLEKGHSQAEAEKEIDVLMSIMTLLRSLDMSLQFDDYARLRMELDVNTK